MPARDLDELNRHIITSKVQPHDLVGAAVEKSRTPSDVSAVGQHIEVTITNFNRPVPLYKIYSVKVERFDRDGVHLFDDFIDEAIGDLTRPQRYLAGPPGRSPAVGLIRATHDLYNPPPLKLGDVLPGAVPVFCTEQVEKWAQNGTFAAAR